MIQHSNQNISVFYFDKGNVGISFYNSAIPKIQCSQITNISNIAYESLKSVYERCSIILTNNPLHQLFSQIATTSIHLTSIQEKSFQYDIIEHHLFKVSLHMNTIKNQKAYFKKMAQNSFKFNALGAMLQHLSNHQKQTKIYFEDIQYFTDTLFQLVSYGKNQLQFLEIIKQDIHPSLIKGKGQSKQGYSILSAYESYLFSTGSKKILRYLFMNPTYKREILQERYHIIQWMKIYMKDTQKYSKYFRNVHYLETILKKFGRMNAEEEDWKKLLKTLETMVEMIAILKQNHMPKIIQQYVQDYHWNQLVEMFGIFKETFDFNPFCIKSGIDQTLDQLKQTYDNMPHILTLIAKDQEWDLQFRIVFMTQVGYLIKIDKDVELPQQFDSQDWILQFSNNSGKYYSNELTQALDRQYGDTFGEIQDIQKKITFDMQALIVERQAIILRLYWKLCQIECFWGISQLSKNMCKPKLSSQALIISNGWHLLLSGNVIHNNIFSFCQSQAPKHQVFNSQRNLVNMNYSNRCVILTGPNASGKTVYMKQIGIIIYLAHLGFFIPATLAEIPLTDSILFIGKSQSIYNGQQCGFYSQISSLSSITQPYIVSNKTLILIDQLGSEIDYQNSLKLIYATVEYLTSKNPHFVINPILTHAKDEFENPLVVIVTHLSQILNSKIIEESYGVRFLTMMVEEEGICLFKVRPGLVSKGYGLRAAAEIMPSDFISLSRKYLSFIESL